VFPWQTGQLSACNDFPAPTRDVASKIEVTTIKINDPFDDFNAAHDPKDSEPKSPFVRRATTFLGGKRRSDYNVKKSQDSKTKKSSNSSVADEKKVKLLQGNI